MAAYEDLKRELRDRGYTRAALATSDQSVGYGFVIATLYREGEAVPSAEVDAVSDELYELLDLDWDGAVGEDPYGYASIELKA